ncbi:MAG: ankyrin repeat domain-containing protein, partial [Saprospiraceae bacterium]|nr:ankyrin repeat domain-containing protein [Saprospiraceae bacterium]
MIDKFVDGRTDLVFELLKNGYEATSTDKHGTSLVRWCAYYGDVSAIKYLIASGASPQDLGNNYDLNGAVFHGHWQLVQYILELGANPNQAGKETGETPLHSATARGLKPVTSLIVQLLLAAGADPNVQT